MRLLFTITLLAALSSCEDERIISKSNNSNAITNSGTSTNTESSTNTSTQTSTVTDTDTQIETIPNIARGQQLFENDCSVCHELGEGLDDKFYLGVTYNLNDLIEYIESNMPYNNESACEDSCAIDTAHYIQSKMCQDGEDLILCDPDGITGDQSFEASENIIKIAKGAVKFIYECSECHDITPDTVDGSARGANLFSSNPTYYYKGGLQAYIETQMPVDNTSNCDAQCAEEVVLYLQSEFCINTTTYAFCEG